MKRFIAALLVTMVLTLPAAPLFAVPDDYDDMQSHPLRVAAYLIYPVGYTLEWLVFRPFHYVVSGPGKTLEEARRMAAEALVLHLGWHGRGL